MLPLTLPCVASRPSPAPRARRPPAPGQARAVSCRASAEVVIPAALGGPQEASEAAAAPPTPPPLPQLLVVAGDVESGSSVTSEGDICVLGRLSGRAHAGCNGNRQAVIRAQQLDSDQLIIADVRAGERLRLDGPTLVVCSSEGRLALRPQPGSVRVRALEAAQPQAAWPPPAAQEPARAAASAADASSVAAAAAATPATEAAPAAPEPPAAAKAGRKGRRRGGGGRRGAARQPPALSLQALRAASPATKAALLTGCYITGLGLALLYQPVASFSLLFDARQVTEGWIRVGGVLCCLFGSYYLGAAHGELSGRQLRSFYQSTVWGRVFLSGAFAALVALQQADALLLLPALANLAGAVSMRRALERS